MPHGPYASPNEYDTDNRDMEIANSWLGFTTLCARSACWFVGDQPLAFLSFKIGGIALYPHKFEDINTPKTSIHLTADCHQVQQVSHGLSR